MDIQHVTSEPANPTATDKAPWNQLTAPIQVRCLAIAILDSTAGVSSASKAFRSGASQRPRLPPSQQLLAAAKNAKSTPQPSDPSALRSMVSNMWGKEQSHERMACLVCLSVCRAGAHQRYLVDTPEVALVGHVRNAENCQ